MFIELTDHLRCPADHDEAYLVLIPDQIRDRQVERGVLGCPVCDRQFAIRQRVALLDPPAGPPPDPLPPGEVTAAQVLVLLGLEGPGGYVILAGQGGRFGQDLLHLLPGVQLVAVNPPASVAPAPRLSLIRSCRLPLKARSVRGVLLGEEVAADPAWQREAARVVLPGLRVVGATGAPGPATGLELLAGAGGWWVAG